MTRAIIKRIRTIARARGWAIGVHGSLVRDIDLIAVPWVAEPGHWTYLVRAICEDIDYLHVRPEKRRPHGRMSVLLLAKRAETERERVNRGEMLGPVDPKGRWFPPAIDLSIMDPLSVVTA